MSHASSPTQHDDTHGAYVRGSMDVSDQQATWKAFSAWAKWGTLHVLGLTFFLIFWLVAGMPIVVAGTLIGAGMAVVAWFFESPIGACLLVFAGSVVTSAALAVIMSLIGVLAG